ncbi:MAG: Hpt domain-containing protein, partial [Methanobacteriota archaeon]
MVLNGDDFLAKLLETFRGEAQEHLSAIAAGLLILEKSGISPDEFKVTIEQVFRETHSLKGAARAVGLRDIETLCQHQESVFSAVKKGSLVLRPDSFDLFHAVIKTLELLLAKEKGVKISDLIQQLRTLVSSASMSEGSDISEPKIVSTVVMNPSHEDLSITSAQPVKTAPPSDADETGSPKRREDLVKEDKSESETAEQPKQPLTRDEGISLTASFSEKGREEHLSSPLIKGGAMVKISSDRLENLFARADDLMGARLASGQRSSSLRDLLQNFMSWRWAWSQIITDIEHLRTETGKIEDTNSYSSLTIEIERITSFLEYNRAFIRTLEGDLTILTRAATRDQYLLDTATTELIDEIKQVILVPASSILDTYPRVARDLARESGKNVDVQISGAEIEIDRRILDSIRDPILHIIRNSIDHGIESPDVRQAKGKSERGLIQITVDHARGHQAEIHIIDDGAGIDISAVKSIAIAKGLITAEELSRMDTNQMRRIIFKSGFSTK